MDNLGYTNASNHQLRRLAGCSFFNKKEKKRWQEKTRNGSSSKGEISPLPSPATYAEGLHCRVCTDQATKNLPPPNYAGQQRPPRAERLTTGFAPARQQKDTKAGLRLRKHEKMKAEVTDTRTTRHGH